MLGDTGVSLSCVTPGHHCGDGVWVFFCLLGTVRQWLSWGQVCAQV